MVLGTGSHVGKTTIVAGLCRIFADRGIRVSPFKSQNMALNSFVTEEGDEIARATAVQAQAARTRPLVHMNPLLLKPKADDTSQLIVHGRPMCDVTAQEYFAGDAFRAVRERAVEQSLAVLRAGFELVVAEGAGSCAEPNLRAHDLVNLGLARRLDARAVVVADVDQGGTAAELLGTLRVIELVHAADRRLIAGFILNKFRGDRAVLQPAIDFIERHGGVPVLGVVPFEDFGLEEEDQVRCRPCADPEIDVAVVHLPHISNATDLDALGEEPHTRVRYVRSPAQLGAPDAVVLPGTKNTVGDLLHLRRTGFAEEVIALAGTTPVLGICGGFQMLGHTLDDDRRLESGHGSVPGLGLLDVDVEFRPGKTVGNRRYTPAPGSPLAAAGDVVGYEIHSGVIHYRGAAPLFRRVGDQPEGGQPEGAWHESLPVLGTQIHDLFKNPRLSRTFVDWLRARKGLAPLTAPLVDPEARREERFDRLATVLAENLTIDALIDAPCTMQPARTP
jgi:adenosylcobyric acid synthase